MDHLIYTAMSGASYAMDRQATLAQNLANSSTTGYRADTVAQRAVPLRGQTPGTRVFTLETTTGSDFTPGPMQATGRNLDVAIQGSGWLAVQASDGNEAYTRAGSLQVGSDGTLQLPNGLQVQGDGGPIQVPDGAQLEIGTDGTIYGKTPGQKTGTTIGKLKLVNPDAADMVKGTDGLFRTRSGDPADADPNVRVADGELEGSNVNPVDAMVGMIDAARQFELQTRLLTTAEQNDQKASALLSA
ncbi:MAG TPA: flagellar basal-body rod protein FlgF [Burkholderiaceae bacterium]|nr:flagellar basal-body rod protein FlgF [Burkholderiaceae bacterium]